MSTQTTPPTSASWQHADGWVPEDDALRTARERAAQLGCSPVSPACGALLRLLATAVDARHVVEVGTGTGVSATWLMRGMRPGGVLTTVDVEAEHQRVARDTFRTAGLAAGRFRQITGRALEVLPRLTDGAYDMVFVDGDKVEYGLCLDQALRLLRPGGLVAFDDALWHDRVADPSRRDPETLALRDLADRVREDERLVPALMTVGDGLLAAVVRPAR